MNLVKAIRSRVVLIKHWLEMENWVNSWCRIVQILCDLMDTDDILPSRDPGPQKRLKGSAARIGCCCWTVVGGWQVARLEDILESALRILNRINTWGCERVTASLVTNIWPRILVIKTHHWLLLSLLQSHSMKRRCMSCYHHFTLACPVHFPLSLCSLGKAFSQPELKLIRVACQTQSKANEIPWCQLTGQSFQGNRCCLCLHSEGKPGRIWSWRRSEKNQHGVKRSVNEGLSFRPGVCFIAVRKGCIHIYFL